MINKKRPQSSNIIRLTLAAFIPAIILSISLGLLAQKRERILLERDFTTHTHHLNSAVAHEIDKHHTLFTTLEIIINASNQSIDTQNIEFSLLKRFSEYTFKTHMDIGQITWIPTPNKSTNVNTTISPRKYFTIHNNIHPKEISPFLDPALSATLDQALRDTRIHTFPASPQPAGNTGWLTMVKHVATDNPKLSGIAIFTLNSTLLLHKTFTNFNSQNMAIIGTLQNNPAPFFTFSSPSDNHLFNVSYPHSLGDLTWTLSFQDTATYQSEHPLWAGYTITAIALVISLLLTGFFHNTLTRYYVRKNFTTKLININEKLSSEVELHNQTRKQLSKELENHSYSRTILQNQEKQFKALIENTAESIIIFDAETLQIQKTNRNALNLFPFLNNTPNTALSTLFPDQQPDEYDSFILFKKHITRALHQSVPMFIWSFIDPSTNENKICEVRLATLPDNHQSKIKASLIDITWRQKTEAMMQHLSMAIAQTADSVIITNKEGIIEYVNPAFEVTTGYSAHEVIGKTPHIINSGKHDNEFYKDMWNKILNGEIYRNVFINRHKNGSLYYEEKTISPVRDKAGVIINFVSTGKDITARIRTEEHLHRIAYHDILTELPNRLLFMERLEHALERRLKKDQMVALMFIDMDHFKKINDTLGHDVGDDVLKVFANTLTNCVRKEDTVARLGGDEFGILIEEITHISDINTIAEKIIDAVSQPILIHGHELFITTSIGISLYPGDGDNSLTLLKHADTAMYRAKENGRNSFSFYSSEMSRVIMDRLRIETELHHAIDNNELILHYQPQIDIKSAKLVGLECLIRWNHPTKGLLSPDVFIPLLEETGLITMATQQVLHQACMKGQEWEQRFNKRLRISVNLSGQLFLSDSLAKTINQTLDQTGFDPALLELEITESVLMQHNHTLLDNIQAIHKAGIRLALDDFGTGYSSLSYLKRFPVDTLKIDRSFIKDITRNNEDASIVKAIIAMAHSLNLNTVVEGVETQEQLDFVRQLNCDQVQGFFYSPAVSDEEIEKILSLDNWPANQRLDQSTG